MIGDKIETRLLSTGLGLMAYCDERLVRVLLQNLLEKRLEVYLEGPGGKDRRRQTRRRR